MMAGGVEGGPAAFGSTKSRKAGRGSGASADPGTSIVSFVGSAVAKYDVDELDDLGRQPKREKFVEVRRPDGTIAKSRGERTFYGAFTGGFTAGYWGTVGSKEGWEPSTFSSSRSKRAEQSALRVEDLMDEEDLRDHRASHRTLETHGEFGNSSGPSGAAGGGGASRGGPKRGGGAAGISLPKDLERELFESRGSGRGDPAGAGSSETLGERLLRAGEEDASSSVGAGAAAAAGAGASGGEALDAGAKPAKRRYGCAPPPPSASTAGAESGGAMAIAAADEGAAEGLSWQFHIATSLGPGGGSADGGESRRGSRAAEEMRRIEAERERLWRSKVDCHGLGFGQGGSSGSTAPSAQRVPSNQRLYMNSKRVAGAGRSRGYGDFGTGVFDQDEYDQCEDIYDAGDKRASYDLAIKDRDEDVEEVALACSRSDSRAFGAPGAGATGEVPGFVPASSGCEDRPDGGFDLDRYLAPRPPRGYRGVCATLSSVADEARSGSAEHQQLLDFLERHGDRRLVDPAHRAELLGLRRRRAPAPAPAPAASASAAAAGGAPSSSSASGAAPPGGGAPGGGGGGGGAEEAAKAASGPLWKGVDDSKKEQLLQALGRNFVVGNNQDMDGKKGRHQPFCSEPAKQRRYAAFCLAIEGKASAAEALGDTGGLSEAERQAELAEFGRVFRMFKQEHPNVDVVSALEGDGDGAGGAPALAPVLRRTVQPWAPDRLLCKRWGVPDPSAARASSSKSAPGAGGAASASAKRQREYAQQVQAGLARLSAGAAAPGSTGFSDGPAPGAPPPASLDALAATAASAAPAAPAAPAPGGGEPPRPPKSLFTSIFGDDASDDDEGS